MINLFLSKKILTLFVIFLFVNLTPAFATQMEEVAKDAQSFDAESKIEKGFFAKIKFIAKGFKLLDRTKKAQKDAEKLDAKGSKVKSDDEKLDQTGLKQLSTEKQQEISLKYRNRKISTTQPPITNAIQNNNTKNDNNTYNKTNGTLNDDNSEFQQLFNQNIHSMAQSLLNNGIVLTTSIQKDITKFLTGHIVQLIDENGNIRYAYVKSIQLTGGDQKVTLITDENSEKTMALDDFKKSYTGYVMTLESDQIPESVIGNIIKIQKKYLEEEMDDATKLKDKFKSLTITGAVILGLGLILAIIGTLLAVYCGNMLIREYNNLPPSATHTIDFTNADTYEEVMSDMNAYVGRPAITPSQVLEGMGEYLDEGIPIEGIVKAGFTVTALGTPDIVVNSALQNWIKVILTSVGIILALVGIGLMIAGLIKGVHNGIKLWYMYGLIKKIDQRGNDSKSWQKNSKKIIKETNEQNLFTNKTNQKITINQGIPKNSSVF